MTIISTYGNIIAKGTVMGHRDVQSILHVVSKVLRNHLTTHVLENIALTFLQEKSRQWL